MKRHTAPACSQRIERVLAGHPVVLERHDPLEPAAAPQQVLCLHGMADTATTWQPLRERLPRAVLWTFEMPWSGRGGHDWPHRMSATDWWRAALACCPVEPDLFVGHSFGAMVLLDWLCGGAGPRTAPRRLMLLSPYFLVGNREVLWGELAHFADGIPQRMAAALRAQFEPDAAPPARVQQVMVRLLTRRIPPAALLEFFRLYLSSRLWDLRRVAGVTDVLLGCDDEPLVQESAVALQRALPAGRLHRIPGCGHYPMHERPEALARAVTEALEPAPIPSPGAPPPVRWPSMDGLRRPLVSTGVAR
jgi:pimeloyl-ACP methyl ester carboxylesterase